MKEQKAKKKRANSSRSVFADPKQYVSFFAALLIIQSIFWMLLISGGTNEKNAEKILNEEYKHHFILENVSGQAYADLQNMEQIEIHNTKIKLPAFEFLGGNSTDGYNIGVILDRSNINRSNDDFWYKIKEYRIGISTQNAKYTPLYTESADARSQNRGIYIILTLVLLALCFTKYPSPKRLTDTANA